MKRVVLTSVLLVVFCAFWNIHASAQIDGNHDDKAWKTFESLGLKYADKISEDSGYRSLAIAALFESVQKGCDSFDTLFRLLELFRSDKQPDLRKVAHVVSVAVQKHPNEEKRVQRVFSEILELNGEPVGAAVAMQKAIDEKSITADDALRFVRLVRQCQHGELDGLSYVSKSEQAHLLQKVLDQESRKAVQIHILRSMAELEESTDPDRCKKHLLSALQKAETKEQESDVLIALLQSSISLPDDQRLEFKKRLFGVTSESPEAINTMSEVFASLLNQGANLEIVRMWEDKSVAKWRDGALARMQGSKFCMAVYAQALYALHRYKGALDQFQTTMGLRSRGEYWNIGDDLWWQAKCRLAMKDSETARKCLESAITSYEKGLVGGHDALRKERELHLAAAKEQLKELAKK